MAFPVIEEVVQFWLAGVSYAPPSNPYNMQVNCYISMETFKNRNG